MTWARLQQLWQREEARHRGLPSLQKLTQFILWGHMVRLNLSAGKELVQGSATQKEHGLQGQSFLKTETFQEKFEICEILVIYGPYGQT